MSTPDDQNAERGQVAPPWKRGEKAATTGLTAGEMAKAAAADDVPAADRPSGDRPSGPAPRGVVSGEYPKTSSLASGPIPAQSATNPGQPAAPSSGSQPRPAPAAPPKSASDIAAAVIAQGGSGKGSQPPSGAPQTPPAGAAGTAKSGFVESETRNIPRNDLAMKEELPDLDAIHHVEASKEAKAAAVRAQSQTIPGRSIGVPLRAAVQIRRVDPWSVFKVVGVLSVAGFFIWMIAVAVLYGVLDGMGVWEQINGSFSDVLSSDGSGSSSDLIGIGQVFGFSAAFGVAGAVLMTALATVSAYIYNVCSDMVGGIEVTLADLD